MKIFLLITIFIMSALLEAQEKIVYQTPPPEILELVDIDRDPLVELDSKKEQMLFYYRPAFKTLSDLNQPELRLAGLRINPEANISSTLTYYYDIRYQKVMEQDMRSITGLPEQPLIAYVSFSPDETKIAFTHTAADGVELWMADLKTLTAVKLTNAMLNANAGQPYTWFPDSRSLLVRMLPKDRKALTVRKRHSLRDRLSRSAMGRYHRTALPDLLKNPLDEANLKRS